MGSLSSIDVFRGEAERLGWTVEPHGYFRNLGVTARKNDQAVSIDVDRLGRVLNYVRHSVAGEVLSLSWAGEDGKLATAIGELKK